MDINEEEGEDEEDGEEEDVDTDIVEEESEPEDFDEDGLFMLTTAAEQYNIFRKNNARLASATSMNEISKNKKKKIKIVNFSLILSLFFLFFLNKFKLETYKTVFIKFHSIFFV